MMLIIRNMWVKKKNPNTVKNKSINLAFYNMVRGYCEIELINQKF